MRNSKFLRIRRLLRYYIITFLIGCVATGAKGADDEEGSKLMSFRKLMLDEVNFVRTRPAEYAETRLLAYKKISTDNGAYDYLKKIKPVKGLVLNENLNSAALEYAKLMARKDVFGHFINGTPFERAKKAGYKYYAMGENIACGSEHHFNAATNPESSAIGFVRMLIIDKNVKDLGHRKTMVNPVYRSVGIGFAHNQSSYCINYVVQDFGNP